jgi:short-subunit dehydrogenase
MAMIHAVLPQFRARRSGVIVNVTSSATLAPMPLVAVYTASKTAIEGFTASLAFELEAFGVHVKLVEPGYSVTSETDVAEAVWRAANDSTGKLRFPAGADAVALARSA